MGAIDKDLFIIPGKNITKGTDLKKVVNLTAEELRSRWSTKQGKSLLKKWKQSDFNRKTLEKLVGKYYGQLDLRGIPLSNQELKATDLSKIDFFSADFANTSFAKVNLNNSWLSHSSLEGTRFEWCTLDKVLLDEVSFDVKTEFIGVNLNEINFHLATRLKSLVSSQQS